MAVKIGHASISEKGTINGAKGDSTGREVCIRDWYNKEWNVVLRPKNKSLAEKQAKACEDGCANPNIGYGQADRNSAYQSFKKVGSMKKIGKSNVDCSAFMTLCAIAAGVDALNYTSNAPSTSTMRKAFKTTGKYKVLTDSKYLTSDKYLKRGDILVKESIHTAMVLSNGSAVDPLSSDGSKPSYKVGGTYALQVDGLTVRNGAGTGSAKVTYANLTKNAKTNAYPNGTLKKGTKVTCKATKPLGMTFGCRSLLGGLPLIAMGKRGLSNDTNLLLTEGISPLPPSPKKLNFQDFSGVEKSYKL